MDEKKEQRVKVLAEKIFRELYGEYGWGEMAAWTEAYKRADNIVNKR